MRISISILFLILSFLPFSSFSQYFTIDTIKGQSPINKDVSYIFPHLTLLGNQAAADLINTSLIEGVLWIDSGDVYKSIFEKVWGDTDWTMPRVTDLSYEVINNDDHFLCISISGEGCGAYCDPFTQYYVRDSKSGREIRLEELLSTKGLKHISESIKGMRNQRIEAVIERYKGLLAKGKFADGDDPDYYKTAIDIFKECEDTSHTVYVGGSYSLDKEHLMIYTGDCLPHVIRALDDVDYTFTFDLKSIKKYLSSYGKSLLKL